MSMKIFASALGQIKVQMHVAGASVVEIEVPAAIVRSAISMANEKGAGIDTDESKYDWAIVGHKKKGV